MTARPRFTVALVLVAVAIGYLGQGSFRIGARSRPPAVAAVAVGTIGDPTALQSADLLFLLSVRNEGADPITVLDAEARGPAVTPVGVQPAALQLGPGQARELRVETAIDCASADPLTMPALVVELSDGARRSVPVAGAGLLLEACARPGPQSRPVRLERSIRDGASLVLELTSPTARRLDVVGLRAGGVPVTATPLPVTLGRAPVRVRLSAPAGCGRQWQVAGLPVTLSLDVENATGAGSRLAPSSIGSGTESGTESGAVGTVPLEVGPVLADWLLATACPVTAAIGGREP